MGTKPVLDERRLLAALKEQNFEIKKTASGYLVWAPNGGSSGFHPSVFESDVNRGYLNQMAQLARIGFDIRGAANGASDDPRWKQERAQIEALIAEQTNEASVRRATEEAEQAAAGDRRITVDTLHPAARETYDLIAAEPGLSPADYADRLHLPSNTLRMRMKVLRDGGLIEATGTTMRLRYWLAGQVPADAKAAPVRTARAEAAKNGRPSAGPVTTRQIEPGDAVVRFKRMGQKAARLKDELETIIEAMVGQYEEQEAELTHIRGKAKKLEQILGQAVDHI